MSQTGGTNSMVVYSVKHNLLSDCPGKVCENSIFTFCPCEGEAGLKLLMC